jgi:hypothetical protein
MPAFPSPGAPRAKLDNFRETSQDYLSAKSAGAKENYLDSRGRKTKQRSVPFVWLGSRRPRHGSYRWSKSGELHAKRADILDTVSTLRRTRATLADRS